MTFVNHASDAERASEHGIAPRSEQPAAASQARRMPRGLQAGVPSDIVSPLPAASISSRLYTLPGTRR
jgi:hypothetical protein